MAISVVQSITASGTTSATSAHFNSNPTAGNVILVGVFVNQAVQNRVASVTDAAGNTYNRVTGGQTGTGQEVECWQANNIVSGGATHTVTVNAVTGDAVIFVAAEISGLAATNSFDAVQGSFNNGTSISTGATFTTRANNELVVCIAGETAVRPFTAGTGFTIQQQNEAGSNGLCFETKIVSTTGQQTGTCSIDIANDWCAQVLTFADTSQQISRVNSTIAGSADGNAVTTTAMDTTGSTLLIAVVANGSSTTNTPTDSKNNAWTALTTSANGIDDAITIYYSANPTVGTGHTFTETNNTTSPSIGVLALRGTATTSPFDVQNGNNSGGSNTSSISPGSVTPGQANEILITGVCINTNVVSNLAVNSGFEIDNFIQFQAALSNIGLAVGYLIQTTAAAKNPTWSWTTASPASTDIATFKAPPTAVLTWQQLTQMERPYFDSIGVVPY